MQLMAIPSMEFKHIAFPRRSRVQSIQNQAESPPQGIRGGKVLGLVIPHTYFPIVCPAVQVPLPFHSKVEPVLRPLPLGTFTFVQMDAVWQHPVKDPLEDNFVAPLGPQALARIKDQPRSRGTSFWLQQHKDA